eukprot:11921688-Alexandrium_andersonii.AAC.1
MPRWPPAPGRFCARFLYWLRWRRSVGHKQDSMSIFSSWRGKLPWAWEHANVKLRLEWMTVFVAANISPPTRGFRVLKCLGGLPCALCTNLRLMPRAHWL